MNVLEQIYEFEKLIEIISPGFKAKEGLNSNTILNFLNIAQIRFTKERYLNSPTLAENIVNIHNKQDELRNLIVQGTLITPVAIVTGILNGIGYTVALPTGFLAYLRSDTLVSRTAPNVVTSLWTANLLSEDYGNISKIVTTPYNKPILRQPVVYYKATDSLTLVKDGYTTITLSSGFSLDYLRQPKYLGTSDTSTTTTTTTCELIGYLHEEIVKLAVDIYLKEYKMLLVQKDTK